jgi:hypothetical protein
MKIYNSKGELTRYGLAHGGIEEFEGMAQRLTLEYKRGAFYVCQYSVIHRKVVVDGVFFDLREARKFYYARKKTY